LPMMAPCRRCSAPLRPAGAARHQVQPSSRGAHLFERPSAAGALPPVSRRLFVSRPLGDSLGHLDLAHHPRSPTHSARASSTRRGRPPGAGEGRSAFACMTATGSCESLAYRTYCVQTKLAIVTALAYFTRECRSSIITGVLSPWAFRIRGMMSS